MNTLFRNFSDGEIFTGEISRYRLCLVYPGSISRANANRIESAGPREQTIETIANERKGEVFV